MQSWTPSPLASASRPEPADCDSSKSRTPDRSGKAVVIMTNPPEHTGLSNTLAADTVVDGLPFGTAQRLGAALRYRQQDCIAGRHDL